MMLRAAIVLVLIAGFVAGGASAQETFEVPAELELPAAPLVIDLDAAGLDIVFEADAVPTLRAFAGAPDAAPAVLTLSSDGGTVVLRRAPGAADAPAAAKARLRLELVLDPTLRLDVFGSDLNVVVTGPAVAADDGEAEADDDDVDERDDEDDEDDEDENEEGEEGEGGEPMAVPLEAEDPHSLFFNVAASSLDLIGVAGASVNAVESFVHAGGTHTQLTLLLEAATAEVAGHQGRLDLESRDSEITVSDPVGLVAPVLSGGSLIVSNGAGHLQGRLLDALLRVEGWRGGRFAVAGSGAVIEARGFFGGRVELKGDRLDVSLEDLQGQLQAELIGGSFNARQLGGTSDVNARDGAELSLDGVQGQSALKLVDSSARMAGFGGILRADVTGGRLEVDGVRRLELAAVDAEIVAGRVEFLPKADFTDSRLDLDLWEMIGNLSLNLQGATEARVRLRMPCSVKLGEVDLLAGKADVTGCELHSQTVRRVRGDLRGVDGNRRVLLTATLGEESTLEVDGAP